MASNAPAQCCVEGFQHKGTVNGISIKVAAKYDAYLATPPEHVTPKKAAILYVSDVMGIYDNSKLLADRFAAHGYTTLIMDLFNGDQLSLNQLGKIDILQWLQNGRDQRGSHTVTDIDPIIEAGIQHLRISLGYDKIGAVGYCFGAKYVCRHLRNGIDAGFVAHPSFVEEQELAGVTRPLSIAAAEIDSIFTSEKRHKSEEILQQIGQFYQINLYSGVKHGFAVRCDLTDGDARWAQQQAFNQATTWFDRWLRR